MACFVYMQVLYTENALSSLNQTTSGHEHCMRHTSMHTVHHAHLDRKSILTFIFEPTLLKYRQMEGPSMFPTLGARGEVVVEDRLTLRLFPDRIARGDLVVLKSPIMPERIVCKRVLGLPGDVICVDPTGETAPSTEHIIVPKGHIWISGDNAPFSRDSRMYGPVSMSLLQGKLLMRVSR